MATVALLALALLVVPMAPAAANTTVKVNGDDVTITVHVDCVGCKEWRAPGGGSLARHWKKEAEKAWKAAFDKFSYCNKYKFKLEIDMRAGGYDLEVRDGAHQIQVQEPGAGYGAAGWDGVLERTPGGLPGQSSPDGTRYYTDNGGGIMPADATPTVIAHEFGHVIGLGDDRDASGNVLSGRDRTLMAGGSTNSDGTTNTENSRLKIDKQLIERIGDQLVNLGEITCGQVWRGTMNHTVTTEFTGIACPNPVMLQGEVTLHVKPDGKVSGTYDVVGCGVSQPHAEFTGTATDRAFTFPQLIVQTNGEPIPKVSDRRARATLTNIQGGTTTWVTEWDLRCEENCNEDVG